MVGASGETVLGRLRHHRNLYTVLSSTIAAHRFHEISLGIVNVLCREVDTQTVGSDLKLARGVAEVLRSRQKMMAMDNDDTYDEAEDRDDENNGVGRELAQTGNIHCL